MRFSLNKEVAVHFKMQRNYKVDLSTVRSGWHGYESGSPWDWATFDLAADPGTRLGYFGVHKGWGKISAGSPGTEPSPSGDSPACKAVHVSETAALKWATDPLNFLMVLLNFYDEPDEWIFSGIIPSARVCQAGYPLYHPGTKRRLRTKAPLYISNCGLGGIVTNTMISNCSATAGMSGGPMFYHEPGTESYVAIGITKSALPGDFVPFLKHGFGRTHYNKSSFIGITELPHYYHPELGDRPMASKQFAWGAERE